MVVATSGRAMIAEAKPRDPAFARAETNRAEPGILAGG
jgi:hypothetical protein